MARHRGCRGERGFLFRMHHQSLAGNTSWITSCQLTILFDNYILRVAQPASIFSTIVYSISYLIAHGHNADLIPPSSILSLVNKPA